MAEWRFAIAFPMLDFQGQPVHRKSNRRPVYWRVILSGTSEALRLIELTSARLCEDIGGPGEPFDDGPAERIGEMPPASRHNEITGKAPLDPAWRLRLLRAAWGPDSQTLSSDGLQSLAAGLPADVSVDPTGLEETCVFPPPVGRIVLNLLLLAAASLPLGGTVMLAGSADDLFMQIAGPGAAWPAGLAACAVDQATAVAAISGTPLNGGGGVQMPLTALLAHTSGVRLSFLLSPSSRSEPPMLRLGGS
jgi:hypothetical protein